MRWVYLSPHFDDVVLSCGGLVWEQVQAGQQVEVWTVCAGAAEPGEELSGFAQQLHARWDTGLEAVAVRRMEDEAAVRRLGATPRYWTLPDCIYRRLPARENGQSGPWLVNGEEDLWQPRHPLEEGVVERLAGWLVEGLRGAQPPGNLRMLSPLTLGDHVDHFLTREAAERAARQLGCSIWYYPDYPYAVQAGSAAAEKTGNGWQQKCQEVSRSALQAWQEAVACYESQISTFWSGRAALDAALETYWQSGGGACLWNPVPEGEV